MTDDTLLPLSFPAVGRKKITAFDGGRITRDGDVMLLAAASDACNWPTAWPLRCTIRATHGG
ncbi:hypothetical protein X753_31180 [Mesorhizobium sp. LNJC399B00]|nr:hypothetical protein X753_31180 [Mesorhizobium sp. LNJC399B00]